VTAGKRIASIDRQGKYLLIRLAGGKAVLVHLGMSGTLIASETAMARKRHDHVVFRLGGGAEVVFNDPRRFGLLRAGSPDEFAELARLGPDPLAVGFSADWLHRVTRHRARPIKNLLMDQQLVAGIGNIYANEILFEAYIRPGRRAGRLTRAEIDALHAATRQVLTEAIEAGGSSISDYRDGSGKPGYFQLRFRVYDRAGEGCLRCGGRVRRAVHAGRASFWCPGCQG
jgi:formamidopyrimidine-DNA glycosylase